MIVPTEVEYIEEYWLDNIERDTESVWIRIRVYTNGERCVGEETLGETGSRSQQPASASHTGMPRIRSNRPAIAHPPSPNPALLRARFNGLRVDFSLLLSETGGSVRCVVEGWKFHWLIRCVCVLDRSRPTQCGKANLRIRNFGNYWKRWIDDRGELRVNSRTEESVVFLSSKLRVSSIKC